MIRRPQKISGNEPQPAQNRNIDLLNVSGSGVFVSLLLTKIGGTNDFANMSLFIDGQTVIATTFIGASNAGLNNTNNSGIALTTGGIGKSISVQFNEPLHFNRRLRVVFNARNDANINNVVASAVIGEFVQNPLDSIVAPPRDTAIAKRKKRK